MTCFRMPNGETVHNYCKRTGLCYNNVFTRLDKGKPVEEAVAEAKRRKGHKGGMPKYHINGVSVRQLCIKNNINYNTIHTASHKKGIDLVDYFRAVMKTKRKLAI